MRRRIGAIIHAYQEQGFHRTGTDVDRISGNWLADEVREIGLQPALEDFSLSRVDPVDASLVVNDRRMEGLPLFDGTFTSSAGIVGASGVSIARRRLRLLKFRQTAPRQGSSEPPAGKAGIRRSSL